MNFLKRISELERQVAALKLNVQQLQTAVTEIQVARINDLTRKKPGPKPKEQPK